MAQTPDEAREALFEELVRLIWRRMIFTGHPGSLRDARQLAEGIVYLPLSQEGFLAASRAVESLKQNQEEVTNE